MKIDWLRIVILRQGFAATAACSDRHRIFVLAVIADDASDVNSPYLDQAFCGEAIQNFQEKPRLRANTETIIFNFCATENVRKRRDLPATLY